MISPRAFPHPLGSHTTAAAALYGAAAVVLGAGAVVDAGLAPHGRHLALALLAAAALAFASAWWWLGLRRQLGTIVLVPPYAALVTAAILVSGDLNFAFLYYWLVLYVFHFRRLAEAAAWTSALAAVHVLAVAALAPRPEVAAYWLQVAVVLGVPVTLLAAVRARGRKVETLVTTLLEAAPEGVAIVDGRGRIVRTNARFRAMFGGGVQAQSISRLLPALEPCLTPESRRRDPEGVTLVVEGRRSDGTALPVGASVAWAADADSDEVLVLVRDLSEQVRRERARERELREEREAREALEALRSQLEVAAATDELTGLANRRRLRTIGHELVRLARTRGEPLACLAADIDYFKRINDSAGHREGDAILRRFAAILEETTRAHDLVARLGGDEFVALLPDTDAEGVCALAGRVRTAVSEAFGEPRWQGAVSASYGVAVLGDELATVDDLVDAADAALYEAKRRGRNRCVLFEPELRRRSNAPGRADRIPAASS